MGLRKSGSSKGNIARKMSVEEWMSFEGYCWKFLQSQVLLHRPLVLVILGGDNKADLSPANRLGLASATQRHHTFSTGSDEHTALVTVADHAHSLIPKSRQEDARRVAQ